MHQFGLTKVFFKDCHDFFLELKRDRVLTRTILFLQRSIRGWVYRRRFLRMKTATIKIPTQHNTIQSSKFKIGYYSCSRL